MKYIFYLISASTLLMTQISWSFTLTENAQEILQLQKLEAEQNYEKAFEESVRLIGKIYDEAQVAQIVNRIESKLIKRVDEKVIETQRRSSRGMLYNLSILGYGWTTLNRKTSYDITKFIVQNPEEVSKFPAKVNRDLEALKNDLKSYVQTHSESLFAIKLLTVKALEYANLSLNQGATIPPEEIESIANKALDLYFLGNQTVTACIETHFANTNSYEKSEFFPLLGRRGMVSIMSEEHSIRTFAHTEKDCQSTVNEVRIDVKSENGLILVNFSKLDQLIVKWLNLTTTKIYFGQSEDNYFPHFANPYYR